MSQVPAAGPRLSRVFPFITEQVAEAQDRVETLQKQVAEATAKRKEVIAEKKLEGAERNQHREQLKGLA